ncbi:MAG: PaaI family thioesterase [Anaerolineales bacterium]|jgi:acyl-coenzyme A thioesterase PaaI-like protein
MSDGKETPTHIKQPNSRYCFVCGVENPVGLHLKFYEPGPGEAEAYFEPPDHFQGYPGILHGGITASALDEVVGRAAMAGDHLHFMFTAKLELRYRKPIPLGQRLTLKGKLLRRRGKLAFAEGKLLLEDGSVGAEADAVLSDVPDLDVSSEQLDALGWKIYPD